jgi:cytochrome b subunit of formate dehydrogenase
MNLHPSTVLFRAARVLAGLLLTAGLAAGAAAATTNATTNTTAKAIPNSECLDCHTDPSLTRSVEGKEVPFPAFDTNRFARSVHGDLACVECHKAIKETPHDTKLPKVSCADCHEEPAKQYAESIHGVSHALDRQSPAATCTDCHGVHDILSGKNPDSPTFKLNLPQTCARCHNNQAMIKQYDVAQPFVATQYLDSIHGRALLKMGLIVAPSCNDCHGIHDIKRSKEAGSPIHHENIGRTCGRCHVKVEETYAASVHGQMLARKDKDAPVCTDCHNAHAIESPRDGHFKGVSDEKCGRCHKDRLERYRDTYHGKAMALAANQYSSSVAACYDCHGHHDVLPPSNPASRLSSSNIVQTCSACHPGANAAFASYKPHADPLDGKNYPQLHGTFVFMSALLIGVFALFGVHTFLWLFRALSTYRHDSKSFREKVEETHQDEEMFVRFGPTERFLHILVITSFLLLVATGMPLKFYYTDWAKTMFRVLGGADVARILHHFGAIITFTYFGIHFLQIIRVCGNSLRRMRAPASGGITLRKIGRGIFGPDSLVPNLQDFRDFGAHLKWFFHRGPRPQFDRWTYWEKFDYLAVFWGVAMIGLSGLILWFPVIACRFLPGWMINVAHVIHSDEALLAAGFIFTVHFFNTHFRLERFPIDTVIFSGRLSKTEIIHERKRWYDRLVSAGRLEEVRAHDEWRRWREITKNFGFLFLFIGMGLLVLIVYAMLFTRLRPHGP